MGGGGGGGTKEFICFGLSVQKIQLIELLAGLHLEHKGIFTIRSNMQN